jgi:hypothetical protein
MMEHLYCSHLYFLLIYMDKHRFARETDTLSR